ncbi:hypothetical protein [Rhodanobacter sp. T12-5]|nr:hypothetical protein [Rhodanobacter sp. T12-5]
MRGSCLCGLVGYEIAQLDSPIEHCSCRYPARPASAFHTAACVKH